MPTAGFAIGSTLLGHPTNTDCSTQLISLRNFAPDPHLLPACQHRRRGEAYLSKHPTLTVRHAVTANLVQPSLSEVPTAATRPARLAVFVSGGGSNFRAIHDGILRGVVNAEIVVHLPSTLTSCYDCNTFILQHLN